MHVFIGSPASASDGQRRASSVACPERWPYTIEKRLRIYLGQAVKVRGWPIVQDRHGPVQVPAFGHMTQHGLSHKEVHICVPSKETFQRLGSTHEGTVWSESERKKGVSQVVPIKKKAAARKEAGALYHHKSWYGRWRLH